MTLQENTIYERQLPYMYSEQPEHCANTTTSSSGATYAYYGVSPQAQTNVPHMNNYRQSSYARNSKVDGHIEPSRLKKLSHRKLQA